eukprot:4881041-Alexandrium_andersonii.AAC.1
MSASLVGSEMCIRDRSLPACSLSPSIAGRPGLGEEGADGGLHPPWLGTCLLYTSDAADDM